MALLLRLHLEVHGQDLSTRVLIVDRESFQFYIAQDAHFLAAFSLAYTAVARKAAKLNDNTIAAQLLTLHEGVAKELELHGSYAKVRYIDPLTN